MTGTRLLIALVSAAALAAGNLLVAAPLDPDAARVAWFVGAPLAVGVALALLPAGTASAPDTPPAAPAEAREEAALRLLGVLQEEGRLVDFLEEDLSPYADEQIGAAVRGIHERCQKALRARVTLEPVLGAGEGETVTVDPGFDPVAIRLTGNVHGAPPFRGVVRHAGWRVTRATLPAPGGRDPHVISPAEVELA